MTYTITRSTWLRGEGANLSKLLRPTDGKQCCLGQVALQCGNTPKQILDIRTLFRAITEKSATFPEWLTINDHSAAQIAYDINDDQHTSDSEKEDALTRLFAANGQELMFID